MLRETWVEPERLFDARFEMPPADAVDVVFPVPTSLSLFADAVSQTPDLAHHLERLAEVGFPMERTADESWRHFAGWRVNYESIAYRLASSINAVPAPWSGPRRSAVPEVAHRRFLNRTPDHPEGTPGPFTRPPPDPS